MIGDFVAGATIRTKFNTKSGGTPITLVGGAVSVYKDGSTTQSTAGVTLTPDFDGVTGCHAIAIDTSADGTFYSAGSDFEIVLTAGTVDGVSQAGTVLDKFSISNRVAAIRADVERDGGMLQVTQGHASTASSEASLAKTNAAAAPAATIAGLNTTAVPGSPTAGTYAERFSKIQTSGNVATSDEITDAVSLGSTQPRVNDDAARAYQLDLVSMADGTYKAVGRVSKAVRLRPGAILGSGIAVQIYTGKVFGTVKVLTVHAPTISGGSITAAELGPRDAPDPSAMVLLDGTATGGEERQCTFDITMRTGERVPVTFDIEVFAE